MPPPLSHDYDYIVIGSGFGGAAAALRLSEKGYRVLVLEKGKWLRAEDFPKRNWNLKKWLWLPALRFFGLFKITVFRHVAILSGVGVGGGSLVYANTLAIPQAGFFKAESWAHLADWEQELQAHYAMALRMLGAVPNPRLEVGDRALQQLAAELGKQEHFTPTNVAVYFGTPGVTVPDPYFNGKGPERTGCLFCGGCMLGCRYNAKNTLDKNYLHLARQNGVHIQAEAEVCDVVPLDGESGATGYRVKWQSATKYFKRRGAFTCRGVVFAGGVLGTVKLLLQLRETSLPRLSDKVGTGIRTNCESLIGVTTFDRRTVFCEGIAIGSILHTDEHSHLEPVRYSAGSGFWRLFMSPLVHGGNVFIRTARIVADLLRHPLANLRLFFVDDWSKRTQILLFMRTLESTLQFVRGRFGMKSVLTQGAAPTPFIPEARELAERYSSIVNGRPAALLTETLLGIPTTAHILGGAVMGRDRSEGVIDKDNRVFGYDNMYVCDGAMISANPGVNPSLTILALTERAMSKIPPAPRRHEVYSEVANEMVLAV
ncbi:MAG: GMC oxidoreductase [candidate division KSB1 bacterium]|nr:GMC oxidoreductase [candidate division KSB1 bacterium]MDZ7276310.1 GMC oxidoreductase [candidate division KSB1 bacterium]MDZ7287737.1 GMC oxidoreductase [candidate division KSB1 bacterium]MDZ7299923.1 GMC oxidoreductase [candidate division KSB1 bacterium]MDZ7350922.1 GMC oxidoreductase [candidate division KSB1 bacterium]